MIGMYCEQAAYYKGWQDYKQYYIENLRRINRMDAVKFIEERNRMCKSFCDGCKGCPAFNACEDDLCCAVGNESTLDVTAQLL